MLFSIIAILITLMGYFFLYFSIAEMPEELKEETKNSQFGEEFEKQLFSVGCGILSYVCFVVALTITIFLK